jgi:hypothetical protein
VLPFAIISRACAGEMRGTAASAVSIICLTLMVMPFSPSTPASVGGRILLVANVRKGSKAASLAKSTEPQLLGQFYQLDA